MASHLMVHINIHEKGINSRNKIWALNLVV